MIIWLSSYPRSGNSLLRSICKQCFGLSSFADEKNLADKEFGKRPELIGHVDMEERWDHFYEKATQSKKVHLVKTHLSPRDDQPFIYIVRDGRSVIRSYKNFHRHINNIEKSYTSLIVGDDVYGDWSSHYDAWFGRDNAQNLILHYEELVYISKNTLKKLAEFIGYTRKIHRWDNPFKELKRLEPNLFSEINLNFEPHREWTEEINLLFYSLHGRLMNEVGYCHDNVVEKGEKWIEINCNLIFNDLFSIIKNYQEKCRLLEKECDDRLALIKRLEGICQERNDLICRLHGKSVEVGPC